MPQKDPLKAVTDPGKLGFCADRLSRIRHWMDHYVDGGRLPGATTLVARHGQIAYLDHTGMRDVESQTPWGDDTILRVYSMTKPITSVALMMLHEQARLQLSDPIAEFLPEFANVEVLIEGADDIGQTEPCLTPPTIHHLLTHSAGFTYSFNEGVLAENYKGLDFGPEVDNLASKVKRLAEMPLGFQPGSRWGYSVAIDIVGRIIEIVSGMTLEQYFHEYILDPLGMHDTGFSVADEKLSRFASLYTPTEQGGMERIDEAGNTVYHPDKVATHSGGGGLLSTLSDYYRFAEMKRRGGELDGYRLLSPRTLNFMHQNHMPGDLASMGQAVFSEISYKGVGFGLDGWVMLNPAEAGYHGNPGDHGWGGMASTVQWIDPVEDMLVIFLTQLAPSSTYPLRNELRALVHSSLID